MDEVLELERDVMKLRVRPGESFEVESEWGARTATVVDMPFVDPQKTIPVS